MKKQKNKRNVMPNGDVVPDIDTTEVMSICLSIISELCYAVEFYRKHTKLGK